MGDERTRFYGQPLQAFRNHRLRARESLCRAVKGVVPFGRVLQAGRLAGWLAGWRRLSLLEQQQGRSRSISSRNLRGHYGPRAGAVVQNDRIGVPAPVGESCVLVLLSVLLD